MIIREIESQDLSQLLHLYTYLHDNHMPDIDTDMEILWHKIVKDPSHHILIGLKDGRIISSCVLVIIPNLTHRQRPYALIENVITHPEYRGKGYATKILDYARGLAIADRCYKIMLLTGAKKESTLGFYERAGYNRNDKTAFIQWLNEPEFP